MVKQLYGETFAGKQQGRYKIARDDLKRLAGREKLKNDFVFALMAEVEVEHSLKLIVLADGQYFGVIAITKMLAWRTVPARLIP